MKTIPSKKVILPIELCPKDANSFKTKIMKSKSALITIFYNGGSKEVKHWTANNITEESNIMRNLRSRQEFRQGMWQEKNIWKVIVEVK